MDAKKALFLPAVTLVLGAGAALTLCSTTQAASSSTTPPPTNAEITVKLTAPAGPGHPLALPFVLFQSPPPTPKPSTKDLSSDIKGLLTLLFKPPAVTSDANVTVQDVVPNPLVKDGYVAILGATAPMDAAAVTDAVQKAQNAVGKTTLVVSNITVKGPAPDSPVTLTYALRFLRGTLPSVTATNADTSDITGIGTDKAATDLAAFLSKVYPADDTVVTAHENHLVLTGPAHHVNALRQMLALSLDVPSPQVKADIYTIQVNTTPRNRDAAQDKIEEIQGGIQIVRDFIHGSQAYLAAYLASPQAGVDVLTDGQKTVLTDAQKIALSSALKGRVLTDAQNSVLADAQNSVLADAQNSVLAGVLTKQELFAKMRLAGYDPSPHRPLNLTDMLILLVVSDRKQFRTELTPRKGINPKPTLIDNLEISLGKVRQQLVSRNLPLTSDFTALNVATGLEVPIYNAPNVSVYSRHGDQLVKLIDRIESQIQIARRAGTPVPLFSRLAALYPDDTVSQENDMRGIGDFLDAWHLCQGAFLLPPKESKGVLVQYPDQLSSKSAATDFLLKEAMDALTADLQTVYFQPLLDWIRDDVRGGHAGSTGIDLVGTTSITIRDRTLGETKGTAESYFKFTPIPHLTMDSLTGAKSLANGSPATADTTTQTVATDAKGIVRMANGDPLLLTPNQQLATDPATGLALRKGNSPTGDPVVRTVPDTSQTKTPSALASTVFGALTPLQSLALQAVLSEDATVPSYRKIAPGTSLAIRPFVLPDGGSARVQMSLTSTITSDQPNAAQLAQRDVPFDVISSHTVTTEATISAFDLQTVSSFGAQTTGPGDYAWRIPVLDEIPLLGELFHGPRSRETKRQDSIAIVNLTILPRSLDLVPYYVPAP